MDWKFSYVDGKWHGNPLALLVGLPMVLVIMTVTFGPWVYHVIWCIDAAARTGSAIALLIVGIVLPPLGWVHGVCALIGWGWV